MTFWTPPRIERELAERTVSYNADLLASIDLEGDPITERFSRMLRDIHPRLIMVKAYERIVPGVALRPGYYHILVRTDSAPWNAIPIEGEDGEFTVPTQRVFERLAAGDLHNRRAQERWVRDQTAERRSDERQKANDREERQDHLKELVKAYTQTSVPGVGHGPWTQNQAGRRDVSQRPKK